MPLSSLSQRATANLSSSLHPYSMNPQTNNGNGRNGSSAGNPDRPASKPRTRVFVFESTRMDCELLSSALERSQYGLRVVGQATIRERTELKLAEADVAVIGSKLNEGSRAGFDLLRRLVKENDAPRCVMLLDRAERDVVVEAFRSGAFGVCERSQPCHMLCKCLHCVHLGQVWANSQQVRYLLDALTCLTSTRITEVKSELLLTAKEQEIASLVADALKNREIADTLNLSEHTVKNRLYRLFEKVGVSSRVELILYLTRQNHSAKPPVRRATGQTNLGRQIDSLQMRGGQRS